MALIKAVRGFFDDQAFFEVETPILQVSPVMDTHIHAFRTEFTIPFQPGGTELYLHTSPEFAMKKLMVAGIERMYQLCHTFRNGEMGAWHSPEFTMLEWYRANAGYEDIMDDCEGLLKHVAAKVGIDSYRYRGNVSDPFGKWERMSVAEAFSRYADIDLPSVLDDTKAFAAEAAKHDIVLKDASWDDLFFAIMDAKIEDQLGIGAPTILYDYPACMASLSRKKPDDPRFAERFELYVCGIELANAFGELTDAKEQRQRFEADMALKNELYGEESYPIDEDFLQALEYGLPESGGIAMGIDRLAMLATGVEEIDSILWAPV